VRTAGKWSVTGVRPCGRPNKTTATVGLPTSVTAFTNSTYCGGGVRRVAALLLGQVVAVPAGLAADVQDHDVGFPGRRDGGRDVGRLGGQDSRAGDRGDLHLRQQPSDRLGERDGSVLALA
jgi:hypothetical protein